MELGIYLRTSVEQESRQQQNLRDEARLAATGQSAIAMPDAKALAMATAGNFILRAVTERVLRCDRSEEKDRPSALPPPGIRP